MRAWPAPTQAGRGLTGHHGRLAGGGEVPVVTINPAETAAAPGPDTDPQQAAWQTAVTAAPWLVGEPSAEVPPEKLYEKLKPFEERVAADIERGPARQGRRPGRVLSRAAGPPQPGSTRPVPGAGATWAAGA